MKIVIAGGAGFVGRAVVARLLSQGHDVVVLSRRAPGGSPAASQPVSRIFWDGKVLGEWCAALEGADALINLSGENISGRRWTREYKQILRQTRLDPTHLLVRALGACRIPPGVFINASAVGYYGDAGDRWLDEGAAPGQGFLAGLCQAWEQAALEAEGHGVRVVVARMGIVLGHGGVLEKFAPPFRAFVGGPLGSGRQWMSWISGHDLADAFLFIIRHEALKGPVNCVSAEPLTMHAFCKALGAVWHRPSWLPCPSWVLQAALGEMASVVVSSQRVIPKKLLDAGFRFQEPRAIEQVLMLYLA